MIITRRPTQFELTITARAGRAYVSFLRNKIRRAHRLLRTPLRELSIALVKDAEMSALHERFMNDPSPTDVLTFPLDENARGQAICGEIVVNLSQALRQSRRRGIRLQNELLLYALHGMLHLKGMDDRTDSQYQRMHRLEDRILGKLGVGTVFSSNPRNPAKSR